MELARFLAEMDRGEGHGSGAPPGPANLVLATRVDSTNRLARRIVSEYLVDEEPVPELLLLALEQSAGRGRQGRSWESPAGGVYATRVLNVARAAELSALPLAAAVGLADALSRLLPDDRPCRLKWPNDLLVGERKIGGVLIEALPVPSAGGEGGATVALIGFGVNHAPPRAEGATAIGRESPEPPPLGACTRALADGLEGALARRGDAAWLAERYRALVVHRPGDRLACRVAGEAVEGEFLGFTAAGHLRLATAAGERRLASGELVERAEPAGEAR